MAVCTWPSDCAHCVHLALRLCSLCADGCVCVWPSDCAHCVQMAVCASGPQIVLTVCRWLCVRLALRLCSPCADGRVRLALRLCSLCADGCVCVWPSDCAHRVQMAVCASGPQIVLTVCRWLCVRLALRLCSLCADGCVCVWPSDCAHCVQMAVWASGPQIVLTVCRWLCERLALRLCSLCADGCACVWPSDCAHRVQMAVCASGPQIVLTVCRWWCSRLRPARSSCQLLTPASTYSTCPSTQLSPNSASSYSQRYSTQRVSASSDLTGHCLVQWPHRSPHWSPPRPMASLSDQQTVPPLNNRTMTIRIQIVLWLCRYVQNYLYTWLYTVHVYKIIIIHPVYHISQYITDPKKYRCSMIGHVLAAIMIRDYLLRWTDCHHD